MKINILSLFLYFFILNVSYSQIENNDILEPSNFFNDTLLEKKIYNKLLYNIDSVSVISYIVVPAFESESEYSLTLEKNKTNNYKLIYSKFSKNYQYSKNPELVKVNKNEKNIDSELAELIQSLFKIATSKIKIKNENIISFCDSPSLFFSIYNNDKGMISGQICGHQRKSLFRKISGSPASFIMWVIRKIKRTDSTNMKTPKTDGLINICEELIKFTKSESTNNDKLIKKINELLMIMK